MRHSSLILIILWLLWGPSKFYFQNDDQLLIRFHEILTVFFLDKHLQRKLFMFDL